MNNYTALILREAAYKESDKILTALTLELGTISFSARGSRKPKSKLCAPTQTFCLSKIMLTERHGKFYLSEAEIIEPFHHLRSSIETLSLASYFVEVAAELSPENAPSEELFNLTLSALRALKKRDLDICKAAFEFKCACLAGFSPDLSEYERLPHGVLSALKFVQNAPPKKCFSFLLKGAELLNFCEICQQYLQTQTEHNFPSLRFYKDIIR